MNGLSTNVGPAMKEFRKSKKHLLSKFEELDQSSLELINQNGAGLSGQNKLRAIVNASPDVMLVMDDKGTYVDVLTSQTQLLLAEPEDLIGKNVYEVLSKNEADTFLNIIKQTLKADSPQIVEYELTVQGGKKWFEGRCSRIDGVKEPLVIYVARDITERVLAEKEINDLAKFPAENPDPVLRISDEGLIIYANAASGSLLTEWSVGPGQSLPKDILEKYNEAENTGLDKINFDVVIAERTFQFTFTPIRDHNYINIYCLDLTKRRRAEEAMRESENLYRKLFESVPVGLYRTTPGGQILDVNQALLNILDYPDLATLKKRKMEDIYVNIEDRTKWQRQIENDGVVDNVEVRYYKRDRTKIWVRFSVQSIRDDEGKLMFYEGAMEDISEQKAAEIEKESLLRAEREQRQLAETLGRIGLALSESQDLAHLLDLICRETISLFDVNSAFIWLLQADELVGIAGQGKGRENFLQRRIPLNDPKTLGPRVIRENRAIYINEAERSPEVNQDLISIFGVKAILGVPLVNAEKTIGAMMIIDTHNEFRFANKDAKTATILGTDAANAIDRWRLYESSEQSKLDLELAYDQTLEGWAKALELRNKETEGHSQRVTELTLSLARELGLPDKDLVHLRRGALLHDIGKMGIPDEILLKPGPLTDHEWIIMRKHPGLAHDMLYPIDFLRPALDIPYNHHEKWDGSGYPRGLMGEEIPLSARIFSVVDVWDALLSERTYRKAWPAEKVIKHLQIQAGKHFDPLIVKAFLSKIIVEEPNIKNLMRVYGQKIRAAQISTT